MIRETGVDGVTIARGCIGNPWIFGDCRALWAGCELSPPPSIAEQREAIEEHWADCVAVYGETTAGKVMRKFGIKYAESHPVSRKVRDAFIAVKTSADLRVALERWYDSSADWPAVGRRVGPGDLVAAGACE
jgi:tRNA-dihydrouridine synthase